MKVSRAVERVRSLSGFREAGTTLPNDINDNKILKAMNSAMKFMSEEQYRPFLRSINLSSRNMLANDLFLPFNSFKDNGKIPKSSKLLPKDFLDVNPSQTRSRIAFVYNRHRYDSFSNYVYYPDEYETTLNTDFEAYAQVILNNHASETISLDNLQTYKVDVLVYNPSNDEKVIDSVSFYCENQKIVSRVLSTGVFVSLDFETKKITLIHTNSHAKSLLIKVRTYVSNSSAKFLVHNGEIRRYNYKILNNSINVQAYIIPYYLMDVGQDLPQEVTGDLYDLFCYESALKVQEDSRSIDTDFATTVDVVRAQYKNMDRLKTSDEQTYYPRLSNNGGGWL